MSRIKNLNMSPVDIIVTLCDGNPGAITACLEILKHTEEVDPYNVGGGIMSLLWLDTFKLYGPRIYMLWNDVCNRDVGAMLAVMRAYQLGQLEGVTMEVINHAIENRGAGIDVDKVIAAVQVKLPKFKGRMIDFSF